MYQVHEFMNKIIIISLNKIMVENQGDLHIFTHEELKKYLNNFPGQRVVYDGELGADSLVTPL